MTDSKTTERLRGMAFDATDEDVSNFLHECADEIERMRDALTRIVRGCEAVLLDALLAEDPVHPNVLKKVLDDARAGLGKEQTS